MPLSQFHPAVSAWFSSTFDHATEAQQHAWAAITSSQPTLIAAPTGSGKTLAAFLSSIDQLVKQGLACGLEDKTSVLYISPLKALSNDIQKNLQQPLCGIRDKLLESCLPDVAIRAAVRTGDTPPGERQKMVKLPPHILVTTPESLYILLTSKSGRELLKSVHTVIVDEIHALAGNKRGAHLSLSLQRLDALCFNNSNQRPNRIGLSATQKPIEDIAHFLTGSSQSPCRIIDMGHSRERDITLEIPDSPLEAVMANEVWEEQYNRLTSLIEQHNTTLIFVNNRRLAERAAKHLADRLGEDAVTAHHGSLSREHRLDAEQRLKAGKLSALVATASLELGIDIGDIDLVCQMGSPRSISAFLQRVGRSGHSIGGTPKGRLFPLSRDDLVECTALLDATNRNELDNICIARPALDVLAQQIVAEVASQEWSVQQLFDECKKAWPYRDLTLHQFKSVLIMLADGFSTRRGRRSAYLHYDRVNEKIRARRGANLTAVMNSGAIPDHFDYDVILEPEGLFVGSLNEDFAFESLPGDIFQLGNIAYRISKIQQGKVYVHDAKGQPPTIPFWFGEAPGRSNELSMAVARLSESIAEKLSLGSDTVNQWLEQQLSLPPAAASQLSDYIGLAKACFGVIPSSTNIVFERFFDETGDMHLVIHSPLGSRLNRAWGLALRKRFCRKFNFELQAAATEDNIILSLGPTHSFPLEEVGHYLKAKTVRHLLIQALLDAPVFATRWRWNCNISLAVPRMRSGKRVPAQFQRSNAEDLIALIFPDQLACFENLAGEREVPDHPLINQTIDDCLKENMDIEGLEKLLTRIETGEVNIICKDLAGPSPLAAEIINARPYAFLDDTAAEERRTLAIQQNSIYEPETAALLSQIDPAAIKRVQNESWPNPRTADELHDALVMLGFLTEDEIQSGSSEQNSLIVSWAHLIESLVSEHRVTKCLNNNSWVAAERLHEFHIVYGTDDFQPALKSITNTDAVALTSEQAIVEIIRSRLEGLGPTTVERIATDMNISSQQVNSALLSLEQEGFVVRGNFLANIQAEQWCDRRLLARIHRYTINERRKHFEPVSAADFMRFLFHWQHVDEPGESQDALLLSLQQLEGLSIPAAAWEKAVLTSRVKNYIPDWLDNLCVTGRVAWLRLNTGKETAAKKKQSSPISATPIAILPRSSLNQWHSTNDIKHNLESLSSSAKVIYQTLTNKGALFFHDLVNQTSLLRTHVESGLAELVANGVITADHFTGLRALITPVNRRPKFGGRVGNPRNIEEAGRWWIITPQHSNTDTKSIDNEKTEYIAHCLLRRYGIVFRKLLDREPLAPAWRDLLYCYRRMEARGEIRGGRFVQGFSGEQFALPDAAGSLINIKNRADETTLTILSAADPLNLTGVITAGDRISSSVKNKIVYQNGKPVAAFINHQLQYYIEPEPALAWEIQHALFSHPTNMTTANLNKTTSMNKPSDAVHH